MNTDKTLVRQSAEDTKALMIKGTVESADSNNPTTRRMLLTGGAVTAGAAVAALASTVAEAAPVYLQLGVNNASGGPTRLTSSATPSFLGVTTASNGISVQGYTQASNGVGVDGTSNTGSGAIGVRGTASNGYGVSGTGAYGVLGSGSYAGVYASASSYGGVFYGNASGSGYGVYASGGYRGVYASGGTYGVYATGGTYGSYGTSNYIGAYGSGGSYGLYGNASSASSRGVAGVSPYVGVEGSASTYGVYGHANATSGVVYGVFGAAASNGWAGYFQGDARVTGTLSKAAGSFQIDHPLDPDRKWLQHSFVESPDMMNVYNGNVTTDASGLATVTLPDYFTALNRDFRYQLTVIGKMAAAIIDQEIANNQFRIRTSEGSTKVSWQVTGIRQDDYAKAHPIVVERAKTKDEAGTRAFVAPGVSARVMQVGPTAATIKQ